MIQIAKPQLGEEEIRAVTEVLKSGIIAQGPKVAEFEQKFAEYCGAKYAVAVSNGTTALHAALLSAGVGAGDEVITTPFTFIASANSILHTGAKPVFADIEADTFLLDAEKVKEKITDKTKAIMPVHLYGQCADMKALQEIAKDHNLSLIEDACQAHGAEFEGKKAGSFGIGCFSFYPTKNMTTSEGGMITTDKEEVYEKLKKIRSHGSSRRYHHDILGYNYRMTDIAAAIGLVQLENLDANNQKRIENASFLSKNSNSSRIINPKPREGRKHVFHQYTIRASGRDELKKYLAEKGIGSEVYYPIPVHKQGLYTTIGYDEFLEVAENAAAEVLSLPVHPLVSEEELGHITKTLNEA